MAKTQEDIEKELEELPKLRQQITILEEKIKNSSDVGSFNSLNEKLLTVISKVEDIEIKWKGFQNQVQEEEKRKELNRKKHEEQKNKNFWDE